MEKFIVTGGQPLKGTITVSGAKNAALKTLVAACLTDEEVIIENVPLISDLSAMIEIMEELGAVVKRRDHTLWISMKKFKKHEITLEEGAQIRTSAMFISPLLAIVGEAIIPNPGGCRLGARPIDRIIDGLSQMNAKIKYNRKDGYFHAKAAKLKGITYTFKKSTHVGTETLILAAILAEGKTILKNAAEEPEIDDLIGLLTAMGGNIRRTSHREITIHGVKKLHGATFRISPDRNEIVTFAIAALLTQGDILIKEAARVDLTAFLEMVKKAGGTYETKGNDMRFYTGKKMKATDVTTDIYPGFMTDWQAPWGVLMTKAHGMSVIHETVFENKLEYIYDLKKMGAKVTLFNPVVHNPEKVYNFNLADDNPSYFHAVKIQGPTTLHDAVLTMANIRAGAAVVLAALAAEGTSTIFGIEKLDRGYEKFEKQLKSLGAKIERVKVK